MKLYLVVTTYPKGQRRRFASCRPKNPTTTHLVWAKDGMRMKQFRKLVLDSLEEFYTHTHPSNTTTKTTTTTIQHVLYLDMEIAAARPISGLVLLDYQDQMIQRDVFENGDVASQNVTTTNTNAIAFMSMFTDCPTCARRNTNGGVMMLHTQYLKATAL
jgi:hypothetical protein